MEKVKRKKVYLTQYPHLLAEWHPEKNGDLDPNTVTRGLHKKVWWKCTTCNGEWESAVFNRAIHGNRCPYCSGRRPIPGKTDLATTHPDLVDGWSLRNTLKPTEVSASSDKKILWVCSVGHEWASTVSNRTALGNGCPYCSGKRVLSGFNDLRTTHPDLSTQWSPENSFGPETVSAGSSKRVIWICPEGHEYTSVVYSRTMGTGCPYCSGKRILVGFNDLASAHSDLACEWSPRNKFGPGNVTAGSGRKVWWRCSSCAWEWMTAVYSRTKGTGCPKCCLQQTSKIEGELFRHLSEEFGDAEQGVRVGRWSVDVLIPKQKVVVEYDGTYWHQDREQHDTRKTLDLLKLGYRVVRIREQSNQHTLPSLGIDNPRYLELTYTYDPAYTNLSTVIARISQWLRS